MTTPPRYPQNRSIRLLLVLLMSGLLLPALNALADVRDHAGLFSQQAIQQANTTIAKIRQQTGKDVVVEVFPEIPQELRASYDPAQKTAFFNNWMRTRARQLNVNGIYILINRNPSYLDVGVGAATAQRAFTASDRNQLAATMLGDFRQQRFDQGLQAGVNYIQQRMQANLGQGGKPQYLYQSPNAAPSRGGGLGWGWWILIIVGIVLLFAWLRRLGRRQSYAYGGPGPGAPGGYPPGAYPPGGGGYYPPGGGGGIGRGLLGGLLGGAAGGWLYDRMFGGGHGGSQAYGAPPPAEGQSGQQPLPPDQGQGFEGTGGSFDEPSGGGGDWGGGGDAGGGGGGDQSGGGTF